MKILTVCGMGMGTGLILKMTAEAALKELGVKASVEVADIGTARASARTADLIVTSPELGARLSDLGIPVVTLINFVNRAEMVEKLRPIVSPPAPAAS